MEDKKNGVSLAYWMIVFILGAAVFKQIDFDNFNFKNTGLGIVYTLTFMLSIFFIVRRKKFNK